MDANFSEDELDWMQSVTVDTRGTVLSTEAVENPKLSLLRAGVITEKNTGLVVARKYIPMFNVVKAERPKPKPKPKPKPEPKEKRVYLSGLDFIASRIAFYEAVIGDYSDVIAGCLSLEGSYMALDKRIREGLEAKDLKESALCASAARAILRRECDESKSMHIAQLYIHAISEGTQGSVRLMRLAKKECSVFDEVQTRCGDNARSMVFSGPMDAAVAAATVYTYTSEVAHRYARAIARKGKTREQVKDLYVDAVREAVKWLA